MKALTILNPGRLLVYGPCLDLLTSRGVIRSWYGISIRSQKEMARQVKKRYKDKVDYADEEYFKKERQANDYLFSLNSKYDCFDLGSILAAEKYIEKLFPQGIIGVANKVRGVEASIIAEQPGVLISDYPASALDMIAYQLCKSVNIPTIFIVAARVGRRLTFCYEPEKGLKEYISYHYSRYQDNGLTGKDREKAIEFLRMFKETSYKPAWYDFHWKKKRNILKGVQGVFRLKKSSSSMIPRIKIKVNKMALKKEWGKIFKPIDDSDRIIFFPVQYQPEASTYVRSPYFKNQYGLIESLCISIPAGYTLYVKEHYRHIWRQPASSFQGYIRRFPNLKFLDLTVDSHEIIKKAKLVITLSSTVGWEAFLYGVPVLQFGGAFYSRFKGIYLFQNYANLKSQIKEIIKNHRADEEEILRAVAALSAGTTPGYLNDPNLDPAVLEEENLKNIADTIQKGVEFFPERQKSLRVNKEEGI